MREAKLGRIRTVIDCAEYLSVDEAAGNVFYDSTKVAPVIIIEPTDTLPTVAQHKRFGADLEAMVERVANLIFSDNDFTRDRAIERARSIILGDKP